MDRLHARYEPAFYPAFFGRDNYNHHQAYQGINFQHEYKGNRRGHRGAF